MTIRLISIMLAVFIAGLLAACQTTEKASGKAENVLDRETAVNIAKAAKASSIESFLEGCKDGKAVFPMKLVSEKWGFGANLTLTLNNTGGTISDFSSDYDHVKSPEGPVKDLSMDSDGAVHFVSAANGTSYTVYPNSCVGISSGKAHGIIDGGTQRYKLLPPS